MIEICEFQSFLLILPVYNSFSGYNYTILLHLHFRSQVFIWAAGEFRLHQTFESQQVSDVEFIDLGEIKYLAVTSGLYYCVQWHDNYYMCNLTLLH